jgi:hypothetical protein
LLFLVFFVGGDQLVLELVHRAARLVDEPAEVAGHLWELARPEDHQDKQPDDDQLLSADAEHDANITRGSLCYNANYFLQLADDPTGV